MHTWLEAVTSRERYPRAIKIVWLYYLLYLCIFHNSSFENLWVVYRRIGNLSVV